MDKDHLLADALIIGCIMLITASLFILSLRISQIEDRQFFQQQQRMVPTCQQQQQ
jgi:signal transduction histidine kinase